MTVNLSALAGAGQQFFNNNGNVLSGGKLWSYEAGTTTPQPTYTTAAGNVAHTNPIILDSAGRVPSGQIWLDVGENYKFVLMTSADVTLASYDNITGINGTGITSNAVNVEYDPPFTNAVQTNVEAKLSETVSVKDFGAVGDGVADDTAAIQAALNSGAEEVIFEGDLLYTTTIFVDNTVRIVNRGTVKYGGTYAASNPHFRVTADNVQVSGGVFDGNNDIGSIIQFNVGADYGRVHDATFRNLESKTALGSASGDFACVVLKGNYGEVHDCVFEDCVNTDPVTTNDSFPRAVTITGNFNTVADIQAQNVRNPIITTGSYNHIKDVLMDTVGDNGLYMFGSYNTADGLVMINMIDEPIVFAGANHTVRNIVLDNTGTDEELNAFGFQNATGIVIDGLVVHGVLKCASLFKNRPGNTLSSATIKNVSASISGEFGVYEGIIGTMNADFIDCNINYVKQTGYDYNFFIRISGTANCNGCRFTMSDLPGFTSSGDVSNSGLGLVVNTSWVQTSGSNFRAVGTTPRFTTFRQNNINAIKSLPIATAPREFLSNLVPTSGDWLQGDVIWNSAPTAGGNIGWVCVVAGTPGTWKTFGDISA